MQNNHENSTINIKELAYELYKQDWIDNHVTPKMSLDAIKNYYEAKQECIDDGYPMSYSFDEWLEIEGYCGFLYVCYDEFCETEYLDKEYMVDLLDDNKMFVDMYLADINTQ